MLYDTFVFASPARLLSPCRPIPGWCSASILLDHELAVNAIRFPNSRPGENSTCNFKSFDAQCNSSGLYSVAHLPILSLRYGKEE